MNIHLTDMNIHLTGSMNNSQTAASVTCCNCLPILALNAQNTQYTIVYNYFPTTRTGRTHQQLAVFYLKQTVKLRCLSEH